MKRIIRYTIFILLAISLIYFVPQLIIDKSPNITEEKERMVFIITIFIPLISLLLGIICRLYKLKLLITSMIICILTFLYFKMNANSSAYIYIAFYEIIFLLLARKIWIYYFYFQKQYKYFKKKIENM